jgi:hypothetical protein
MHPSSGSDLADPVRGDARRPASQPCRARRVLRSWFAHSCAAVWVMVSIGRSGFSRCVVAYVASAELGALLVAPGFDHFR